MAETGGENKKIRHVAIIMDGNKRWARKRSLSTIEGHKAGAEAVRKAVEACKRMGIEYLTLYAFSTENWKRPKTEVLGIMSLLETFIRKNIGKLCRENIKLRAIGKIDQIPERTRKILLEAVEKTKNNNLGTLTLALSYGGRAEIIDAVKKVISDFVEKKIDCEKIDEEIFRQYLYAPDIPDPDLLIRTSGEYRISNFLLWQISYSEIWITNTLWPDFDEVELKKAVDAFNSRERRYGGR